MLSVRRVFLAITIEYLRDANANDSILSRTSFSLKKNKNKKDNNLQAELKAMEKEKNMNYKEKIIERGSVFYTYFSEKRMKLDGKVICFVFFHSFFLIFIFSVF